MNKLEIYLDKYNDYELYDDIYEQYSDFDYTSNELYLLDLNFMLKKLYSIRIIERNKKRLGQTEFRTEILKKFNNKCIITGQTCQDELTAAHIIPVHCDENYDIDNGLLLIETLHRTFDKYKWSINLNTLMIETKKDDVGSIKDYENTKINLVMNDKLYDNLNDHYMTFSLQKN